MKTARTKMNNKELQEYLQFKRRGNIVKAKKGKGSEYNRAQSKKVVYTY